MSLKFLKPVTITTAMLISSTRAETDHSAWASGTTYAAADRCISTTTHRIYASVQGSNTNHNPTTDDGTWWIDVGPTNRWAMFDQTVGSITSQATPLTVVLDPGIISALALPASVFAGAVPGTSGSPAAAASSPIAICHAPYVRPSMVPGRASSP